MRRVAWAALAAGVALLAVGCGGSPGSSGVASLTGTGGGHATTSTTASAATVSQLYNRWAQCMRQHGVAMADPTIGSGGTINITASGVDKSTFDGANQACQALHQAAQDALRGGAPASKPDPAKLLNFAKCMRAHGLPDFPDPTGNGLQISTSGAGSDLRPDNPTFQQAQAACQSILGSPRGGERIQVGSGGGPGPGPVGGSSSGGLVTGGKG